MRKIFKKVAALTVSAVLFAGIGFPAFPAFSADTNVAKAESSSLPVNDQFIDGAISQGEEIDYYTVTLAEPGWLTVTYQGGSIGDGYYAVLNENQSEKYFEREISTSSESNPITDSSDRLAMEAGTYIVKVWASLDLIGNYKLKASFSPVSKDDVEPNDYMTSGMPLKNKQKVNGFFTRQDRVDFYSFQLDSSALVDVTLKNYVEEMSFGVYDQEFRAVESQNVSGGTETKPLTTTMQLQLNGGTYYIKCEPTGGGRCGAYQIQWDFTPTPVKTIQINGNKKIAVGQSLKLSEYILPLDASNKVVAWSSGNLKVASVDKNTGIVKGKCAGYADITAEATDGSGVKEKVRVIVAPKKMAKPKVKALGKKKVTISWKLQEGVENYQIQYCKSTKFNLGIPLSASKPATQMTTTLKKGKWYFRIRPVAFIDGENVYGEWSPAVKKQVK